jgi:hypothetical protein
LPLHEAQARVDSDRGEQQIADMLFDVFQGLLARRISFDRMPPGAFVEEAGTVVAFAMAGLEEPR